MICLSFDGNFVLIWAVLMLVFLFIEAGTLGLTTIWFALGSICSAIAAALGLPFAVQFAVFAIVSIVCVVFVRKWALGKFNVGRTKTNADSLIGQKAVVTETISNIAASGRVTVNGMEWSARADPQNNETIEAGMVVVIREINGVKLIVSADESQEMGFGGKK